MKFRLVEELVGGEMLLCPYVVCGICNEVVKPEQYAIVTWDSRARVGDVEVEARHGHCDHLGKKSRWRTLKDWLLQTTTNSVGDEAL